MTNADTLEVVWEQFANCVNKHVGKDERGLLVAWNGASCDMEWLCKITEGRGAHLSFPPCLKHVLDPFCAIQKHKVRSNKLHPNKTKKYLSLSTVYELVTGTRLVNAHDSLVDAKAQNYKRLLRKLREKCDEMQTDPSLQDLLANGIEGSFANISNAPCPLTLFPNF